MHVGSMHTLESQPPHPLVSLLDLADVCRQQQEARKDAQMATNNFAIEESMRLLNSSRAELVAIRRARQKRLARASQPSDESDIVQPADPDGSLTG